MKIAERAWDEGIKVGSKTSREEQIRRKAYREGVLAGLKMTKEKVGSRTSREEQIRREAYREGVLAGLKMTKEEAYQYGLNDSQPFG